MTYRVEYNGRDVEASTLDAAIEDAKDAIAADVGPVSGWTVEHDETINDWFIQGVINGSPVGSTAVVTGPEPTVVSDEAPPQHRDQRGTGAWQAYPASRPAEPLDDHEDWSRTLVFTGVTPAEVFGKATTWLAARPDGVQVVDVGWQPPTVAGDGFHLRVHYRDGTSA